MKKQYLVLTIAAMMSVAAIGCGAIHDAVRESAAPITSTAAMPPSGDITAPESLDTVSVSGKAEIKAVPDKASIAFGVELTESTAERANTQLNARIGSVIAALKGAGATETDISTEYYSVDPDYRWVDDERILQGYQGMAEIEVTGIDLHDVEGFIRKAMSAGADSTGAIQYYSSTYDEIYDEALQEAIKQAHAKAEKIGEAAGFSVTRVHQIQEGYQDTSYQYVTNLSKSMGMDEMAMNDASYDGGISAGEIAVEARVNVVYVIE